MMLICHTVNFLYPKNQIQNQNSNSFSNLNLSIPNNTVPIDYNKIYYDSNDKTEKISFSLLGVVISDCPGFLLLNCN